VISTGYLGPKTKTMIAWTGDRWGNSTISSMKPCSKRYTSKGGYSHGATSVPTQHWRELIEHSYQANESSCTWGATYTPSPLHVQIMLPSSCKKMPPSPEGNTSNSRASGLNAMDSFKWFNRLGIAPRGTPIVSGAWTGSSGTQPRCSQARATTL
jgi:hypothetical protein